MDVRAAAGDPVAIRAETDREERESPEDAAAAHQAQGRRGSHQRLRRRARRRAHLPLHRAVRESDEADPAPVAAIDDDRRDPRRVREASHRRADAPARGRRRVSLRGRLAGRHQRHARDDGLQFEVRRVPAHDRRPRADAHARHPGRARGEDSRVPAAGLLGGARHVSRPRRRVRRALVRRKMDEIRRRPRRPCRAAVGGGEGRRNRREMLGQARDRHRGGEADHAGCAAPVRPHVAAARGQRALRTVGAHDALARAIALRKAQGAHLSADRLARAARGLSRHGEGDDGGPEGLERLRRLRPRGAEAEVGAAQQADLRQREGLRPLRDHPDARCPEAPERARGEALRFRRQALPRGVLSSRRISGHHAHHAGGGRAVQVRGQGAGRPGLARGVRQGSAGRRRHGRARQGRREGDARRRHAGRERGDGESRCRGEHHPSSRAALRRRRCSRRWRARAS